MSGWQAVRPGRAGRAGRAARGMLGSMSSAGRVATYVLPAASMALAAAVILGPGAPRMAAGVRIWGLPVEGSEALALRIEAARRQHGVEDATALEGLEVTATAGGAPLGRWAGSTGPGGIAEALVVVAPAPGGLRAPLRVRVGQAGGAVMLDEELALGPAVASPSGSAGGAAVPGVAQGALRLQVEVARGVLAAPFRGTLRVQVRTEGGAPVAGARLEARAEGADLVEAGAGALATEETDAGGLAEIGITPRGHLVEVALTATTRAGGAGGAGETGRWEGTLPVVPGAIWVDPAVAPAGGGARLRLVSPAPRSEAYVSLLNGTRGRVRGAVVPLAADGAGFFVGELALEPGLGGPLWAVVAGDPFEQGAGTVAWPLEAGSSAAPPRPGRVALLADGLPAAEAREQARAARARRAGLAVVGAAALAEALLVLALARKARRRLAAHLAEASADEARGAPIPEADRARILASARAEPALWALTLAALCAFGFAAVAALATFR